MYLVLRCVGRAWAVSPKIHLLVDSHMCASIEAPGSLYTGRDEREIHILSEGDNILFLASLFKP